MNRVVQNTERFPRPKLRPSLPAAAAAQAGGHDISRRFASDNGGAIPSNLLQIPNTESNSPYLRHCATVGVKPHPARFPEKLPTFFIEFLTDPGDLPAPCLPYWHRQASGARQAGTVLDIFAGSNTTGSAAEKLDRHWMAFEKDRTYLAASAFRFVDELPAKELATLWSRLHSDDLPVAVNRQQREMMLMEKPSSYAVKRQRK
ncbi:MAG: site-specific DNA-methyltransferase [Verrucomicrobia bacterium]|nr:site-specific DNA-methyltransferase [Verrucomicrobiota bacterium]